MMLMLVVFIILMHLELREDLVEISTLVGNVVINTPNTSIMHLSSHVKVLELQSVYLGM